MSIIHLLHCLSSKSNQLGDRLFLSAIAVLREAENGQGWKPIHQDRRSFHYHSYYKREITRRSFSRGYSNSQAYQKKPIEGIRGAWNIKKQRTLKRERESETSWAGKTYRNRLSSNRFLPNHRSRILCEETLWGCAVLWRVSACSCATFGHQEFCWRPVALTCRRTIPITDLKF